MIPRPTSMTAARRAFSLIEVVCALAIAGVLITAVFGVLSITARGSARARGAMRETRLIAGLARTLRRDISAACAFRSPDSPAFVTRRAAEAGERPVMEFYTTNAFAPDAAARAPLYRVEYFVLPSADGYELVRGESPCSGAGAPDRRREMSERLLGRISSWRAAFHDGKEWLPAWRAMSLPAAVRIEFVRPGYASGSSPRNAPPEKGLVLYFAPLASAETDPTPDVSAEE